MYFPVGSLFNSLADVPTLMRVACLHWSTVVFSSLQHDSGITNVASGLDTAKFRTLLVLLLNLLVCQSSGPSTPQHLSYFQMQKKNYNRINSRVSNFQMQVLQVGHLFTCCWNASKTVVGNRFSLSPYSFWIEFFTFDPIIFISWSWLR